MVAFGENLAEKVELAKFVVFLSKSMVFEGSALLKVAKTWSNALEIASWQPHGCFFRRLMHWKVLSTSKLHQNQDAALAF